MAKKKTSPKKQAARKRGTPKWLAHIADDLRPLAMPIAKLTADPRNPRRHSPENIGALVASLRLFGQRKPIVVNISAGAVVEAGNGMLEAAKRLGWTHVAAVKVLDDPGTATGFGLADNRTAELADWDDALLADLIGELQENSPDLAETLLLDDLLQAAAAEGDVDDQAGGEPTESAYQLIVECPGAKDRDRLAERLRKEGLKCRSVTWK